MTAEDFRKKSRRSMRNPRTRSVKVGRFNVTSHAQNRMIERDIPNEEMIKNLCRKASAKSPITMGPKGPSYGRHNRYTTTYINPLNKNVSSIHPLNRSVAKQYGISRLHMKTQTEINREKRRRK